MKAELFKNGNSKEARSSMLRVLCAARFTRHGDCIGNKRTPLHSAWKNLRARCDNSKLAGYLCYGGRGITYCEEWKKFENFKNDMGATWKPGLTLDRIDNNGNYCKTNCRWATVREQLRNQRRNVKFELNGVSRTITEWAEIKAVSFCTMRYRLRNWSIEEALNRPVQAS